MITKARMKLFFSKLEGKDGCNFRRVSGKTAWTCDATAKRPLAHKILRAMKVPAGSIKEIMGVATKHGGHCDCEILFNAKPGLMKAAK